MDSTPVMDTFFDSLDWEKRLWWKIVRCWGIITKIYSFVWTNMNLSSFFSNWQDIFVNIYVDVNIYFLYFHSDSILIHQIVERSCLSMSLYILITYQIQEWNKTIPFYFVLFYSKFRSRILSILVYFHSNVPNAVLIFLTENITSNLVVII